MKCIANKTNVLVDITLLSLTLNIKNINMTEENWGQEFKFKKIDEKIKYLIEELKQIELIIMKHNEICKILNYT